MLWKITYYATPRGDFPVDLFIDSLDKSTTKKVLHAIDILQKYGTLTPQPFNKHINQEIGELRTTGKIPIRILYGKNGKTLIMLHAFIKKTNKLPIKELQLAQRRFKQHLLGLS